jgi:hypothetical protein
VRAVARVRADQPIGPLLRLLGALLGRVAAVVAAAQIDRGARADRAHPRRARAVAARLAVGLRQAVVDRAVEALHVPLEERAADVLVDRERRDQQRLQRRCALGQPQPREVAERGVDDRVGAGGEELRVDVADPFAQRDEPLRVAQRDVQRLVRDPADLLGQRQPLERRRVGDDVAVGRRRRRRVALGGVDVAHPQREAAGGRGVLDHPLDRAGRAVHGAQPGAPSRRSRWRR